MPSTLGEGELKAWQAAGVSYPELIDRLVELAVERHGRRRRNTKH